MKIAIVGAGKLGMKIIDNLIQGGNSVTVIDKEEQVLEKLASHVDVMTILGNAKSTSFLKEHGIDGYDFLVATTDKDEKNICIASFAKAIGCGRVIARVRDPEHMGQIDFIKDLMGIDSIINPDLLITNEIYKYLAEKNTLNNGIFTSGKVSLLEFRVNKMPQLIGLTMPEVKNALPGLLTVAIDRKGKVIIPHSDTVLEDNDHIFMVGRRDEIAELARKVHERRQGTSVSRVMIIGGGKTGYFLAQKLADFGAFVKLIEISKSRCRYLSQRLNNVMILNGDATDLSLLEDENFDEMDAFVTATGFDEENLLLALTAKSHGIEDVIAKVSRQSYGEIIEKMGIDMTLNPLDISANNIARYIQGSKRVISSTLINGQAEIVEIFADNRMPITHKTIGDLKLPSGVIIAAIHRGRDVIIPNEKTKIMDGDRVMIFSLITGNTEFEKLISVNEKKGLFRRG